MENYKRQKGWGKNEKRIRTEKKRCMENKKSVKEQRGENEKKNIYTKSTLMNEWLDQEQKTVIQNFGFEAVQK